MTIEHTFVCPRLGHLCRNVRDTSSYYLLIAAMIANKYLMNIFKIFSIKLKKISFQNF